jgi:hypothetical protein
VRRTSIAAATSLLLLPLGCGGGGGGPLDPELVLTPGTVDFTVDSRALAQTAQVVEIQFASDDCEVLDGGVGGPGRRRLLRFDTVVRNMGELACVIGDPADPEPPIPADAFELDACHGHYHMDGFARYELRHLDDTIAAIGHKQSFCITDSLEVLPGHPTGGFDCSFQGLSAGWADVYQRGVPGQWIDVSGVPGGDYVIVVTVNPEGVLPEVVDVHPNTVRVPFHLPDPSAAVADLDDHANDPSQATSMPVPAAFEAAIQTPGDADWFVLHLEGGEIYDVSTSLLTLADSRLRVFDATGTVLIDQSDDVGPSDPSSHVVLMPGATQDVTVEVTGPGGATGRYRLVASRE